MTTFLRHRVVSGLKYKLVDQNPRLRRFLFSLMCRNEDADILLCGSKLRVNRREEPGYVHAYKHAQSAAALREELGPLLTLALLLAPEDTFVDVGANVGFYSSTLSRLGLLYPQMRFYAFEANRDTAKRLRLSLEGRNVQIFDFALSSQDAELEFVEGSSSATFGFKGDMHDQQIPNRTQRVQARRLDNVGVVGDSIVMKIDVEGHERQVLDGASGLFRDGRVKAVYLDGYRDDSLPQYLASKGFLLYDGRNLNPHGYEYHLLAIHRAHLARRGGADSTEESGLSSHA